MQISLNTNQNHTQFKALKSIKFTDVLLENNKVAQSELLEFCKTSFVKDFFAKNDGNIVFSIRQSEQLDFPWDKLYKLYCSLELNVDKSKFSEIKQKYSNKARENGLSTSIIDGVSFDSATKHYLGCNKEESRDCLTAVKDFIHRFTSIKKEKFIEIEKEHEMMQDQFLKSYELNLKNKLLNF